MSNNTWFTADFHLGHENIIKYCSRPFKNSHHMDQAIVDNYNSIVSPDDQVYILGDFCMSGNHEVVEAYLRKLVGHKHLILGNHDRLKPFSYVDVGFESVHTSLYLPTSDLFLVHDPSFTVAAKALGYNRCLCGHIHNLFKFTNGVLNVGVDVHDFKPISLLEVEREFAHV